MKIVQLELKNFMSHVDTKINFEDYTGLVLIEGVNNDGHYSSNGSGKSTILEGIVYALTGNTLRGVGVNDVVNRNYKKNTRVSLTFMRGEATYVVSRYRKDDEHGDDIVLLKNEEDISKRINKDTQQLLDDTVGISYKILVSTILLGEGLSSKFTQLSDPEKKSLIESTLNLSYDMNEIRSKANTELSKLKLEKSNIEGKISALEGYVDIDVEESEKSIRVIEDNIAAKVQLLDVKKSALSCTNETLNKYVDKLSLIKSSIDRKKYMTSQLSSLDADNSRLVAELTNAEKCEDPRCTTCHQLLSSEESKEAFRETYRAKIETISSNMIELRGQLDSLPADEILSQKYNELSTDINNMRAEISSITEECNRIQGESYQLNSQKDMIRANIKGYNEAMENINTMKSSLVSISSQIERYDYFYKLFSPTGIIIDILGEAVSYINERISIYSDVLLDKRYKIDFNKGKISLVDSTGASYQSLSNGEKRRLDISIQFALHDYVVMYCGMKINCCYIDEILDTLDEIGVDNIFDVLRLKLDYCNLSSSYVITHNENLKNKFDHVITVVKNEKGDSTIL